MLAKYAKMPPQQVTVASCRVEFCCSTTYKMPLDDHMGAREYAVEMIERFIVTEGNDSFLMRCTGLLKLWLLSNIVDSFMILNVTTADKTRPVMYHCDTTVNKLEVEKLSNNTNRCEDIQQVSNYLPCLL
jgi:hypothetical protein